MAKASAWVAIGLGLVCGLSATASMGETLTLATVLGNASNLYPSSQVLDVSAADYASRFDADLAKFDQRNSDTVLESASNSFSSPQNVSPRFFPFGAASVPVNADIAVLGNISVFTSGNYYSFNEAAGATINLTLNSTNPTQQLTELLLFDPQGNFVAIGSGNQPDGEGSAITYTVPSGDGGAWTADVTTTVGVSYNYDLQVAVPLSAVSSFTTHVLGDYIDTTGGQYYEFDANQGDNFTISLDPTSSGPISELLLFDPNGNFVAIADGNAPNGFSSIIDYSATESGIWTVVATGAIGQSFDYDLAIQGATGFGPVNPLAGVPEPATWVILIAGLGAAGGVLRRRRAVMA